MNVSIITSRQIRAARSLIGWSQSDLAGAAGLSRSTIIGIEKGSGNPTRELMARLRNILEGRQVEFLPQEGVRFREPTTLYDNLPGANKRLLDDIYSSALAYRDKTGTEDILIYGLREDDAEKSVGGDYLNQHIERLKLAGLKEKLLYFADTATFVAPMPWYRLLKDADLRNRNFPPIIIYGENIAVVQFEPQETVTIVHSRAISEACRHMFEYVWAALKEQEK
jgi:transcriptional regulator with XRE-family HTH domain